jgi:hypothetical protein
METPAGAFSAEKSQGRKVIADPFRTILRPAAPEYASPAVHRLAAAVPRLTTICFAW